MKTVIIASLAILALGSCKKNYTCECTTTETYGGSTDVSLSTTELTDMKKKYVESSSDCVSSESTYTSSNGDVSTTNIDCTIKKN